MIIDASALIAILRDEPEAQRFALRSKVIRSDARPLQIS